MGIQHFQSYNRIVLTITYRVLYLFPTWKLEAGSRAFRELLDVLLLEEKLPVFLQGHAQSFQREPPVWEQLDSYKRQYVGTFSGLIVNGEA